MKKLINFINSLLIVDCTEKPKSINVPLNHIMGL